MNSSLRILARALLLREPRAVELGDLRAALKFARRILPLLIGGYLIWISVTTLPALFRDRSAVYYLTAIIVPQLIVWAIASGAARAWISAPPEPGKLLSGVRVIVIGFLLGALVGILVGHDEAGGGELQFNLWFIETFGSVWWIIVLIILLSAWPEMIARLRWRERNHLQRAAAAEATAARVERAQTESELRLLQAQVQPHFLYNTLANLRYLIQTQSADALRMADALIDYLRTAVTDVRAPSVTLGQEADHVAHYLALMQMRMQGRLQYSIDVPTELRAIQLPSLMVLTLIENSIKHGIGPQVDGGTVLLRVRECGQQISIEVADTGVGLDLRNHEDCNTQSSRTGLRNTRERLRLTYDGKAELILRQNQPRGTVAELVIPRELPQNEPELPVPAMTKAAPQPLRHRGPRKTWVTDVDGVSIRVVDSWFAGAELWIDRQLADVYTLIWSLPPEATVLHGTATGRSGRELRIGVTLQPWSFSVRAGIFVNGQRVCGDAL